MKKTLSLMSLVLLFASFSFSQTAKEAAEYKKLVAKREKFDPSRNPQTDLQNAIVKAQKENKRIILDVGGEWCVWCIKMDVYLMQNKSLDKIAYNNFVWLKVNMSNENPNKDFLGKYPEISGYPHLFVLEKDGTLLHSQNTEDLEEPNLPIIIPSNVKDKEAFIAKEKEKRRNRSYNLQKFTDFLKKWSPAKS